jgi:hypothetical protein
MIPSFDIGGIRRAGSPAFSIDEAEAEAASSPAEAVTPHRVTLVTPHPLH